MKRVDPNEGNLLTLQRRLNAEAPERGRQRRLNAAEAPPRELAKRLFPSLYESLDFTRDARVPTTEYMVANGDAIGEYRSLTTEDILVLLRLRCIST